MNTKRAKRNRDTFSHDEEQEDNSVHTWRKVWRGHYQRSKNTASCTRQLEAVIAPLRPQLQPQILNRRWQERQESYGANLSPSFKVLALKRRKSAQHLSLQHRRTSESWTWWHPKRWIKRLSREKIEMSDTDLVMCLNRQNGSIFLPPLSEHWIGVWNFYQWLPISSRSFFGSIDLFHQRTATRIGFYSITRLSFLRNADGFHLSQFWLSTASEKNSLRAKWPIGHDILRHSDQAELFMPLIPWTRRT